MVCHYCGFKKAYNQSCSSCGGKLKQLGAGTQKIEEEIQQLIPDARVARLDSDTAQNKSYESRIIKDFAKGEIDILVGTQMVTKGFDFCGVSVVAVIAADSLLGMQDFRADEKAAQLLEQFRGRCGRRGGRGIFIIQTSQPEHPVYKSLTSGKNQDYTGFLMQERKDFMFPPYARIIEVTIKDIYEDRAGRMAARLAEEIRKSATQIVTGPYSPVIDRIADNHIRTIRISLRKDRNLKCSKAMLKNLIRDFEKDNRYDGHIVINADPS
jgi:primosomal protein N' (replication factor Y)